MLKRFLLLAGVPFSGSTLQSQLPVPIAERGPGLVARPELLVTTTGYVPIPDDVDRDGDIDLVGSSAWDGSTCL